MTPRRYDALVVIYDLIERHGWAPTVREIGAVLDISVAPVHLHLTGLEAEGLIVRGHYGSSSRNARALRLTESGRRVAILHHPRFRP